MPHSAGYHICCHGPWATHGHGHNHVLGQNFALVAPTLGTNDFQSLLMVIFSHSLDYRHSFRARLSHPSVQLSTFSCCRCKYFLLCWVVLEADPPDTGAEDNGANMNIKTLPGSARGQQSSADCRASYKMCRESSHRDGEVNWISISGFWVQAS